MAGVQLFLIFHALLFLPLPKITKLPCLLNFNIFLLWQKLPDDRLICLFFSLSKGSGYIPSPLPCQVCPCVGKRNKQRWCVLLSVLATPHTWFSESSCLPLAECKWLWDPRWKKPRSQRLANMEGLPQVRNTHSLKWEMNCYCHKSPRLGSLSVTTATAGWTKMVPIRYSCLLPGTLVDTSAISLATSISYQSPLLPLMRHYKPKISKWLHVLKTQKSRRIFKNVSRPCLCLSSVWLCIDGWTSK